MSRARLPQVSWQICNSLTSLLFLGASARRVKGEGLSLPCSLTFSSAGFPATWAFSFALWDQKTGQLLEEALEPGV